MLFLAFQATSSNFRTITTTDGNSALCVNHKAIMVFMKNGGMFGNLACPEWENSRAVAIVNVEHPIFVTIGFLLTAIGFLLQFLAVPSPKTIAQMRAELKAAKLKDKRSGLP
jgi:hypothetical protein